MNCGVLAVSKSALFVCLTQMVTAAEHLALTGIMTCLHGAGHL